MDAYDRQASEKCFQANSANWKYVTNINEENEKLKLGASLEFSKFTKEFTTNLTATFNKDWRHFRDPDLLRKFKKVTVLGTAALPEDELKEVISTLEFFFVIYLIDIVYSMIK